MQHIMPSSTACSIEQLDHTQIYHCPINHIMSSPKLLLISRPTEGRRLRWPEYTAGYQLAQGYLQTTEVRLKPQPEIYRSDTLPLDHLISVHQRKITKQRRMVSSETWIYIIPACEEKNCINNEYGRLSIHLSTSNNSRTFSSDFIRTWTKPLPASGLCRSNSNAFR